MGISVIEQMIVAKSDARACEDAIVVTADFAAVIDGATTPQFTSENGATGGFVAAQAIADTISSLPADADLPTFLTLTAVAISAAAERSGIPPIFPTAAAAVISARRREVWVIGDVYTSITGVAPTKQIERQAIIERVRVVSASLADGARPEDIQRHDPGRDAIQELLDEQVTHRNVASDPVGYAALAATPPPPHMCVLAEIPADAEEVILASDGYPEVATTLAETERLLATDLASDPLRIGTHAATKAVMNGATSFDDRAYLRVRLD